MLNEHSSHEVHLYEADDRPGGHANTVRFVPPRTPGAESVDVDTFVSPLALANIFESELSYRGFIVLNPSTYPNFLRFLKLYPSNIKILPTEMTFSVSRDDGKFEWAGKDLFTVFCQGWKRLVDPGMWRMLYDVLRFNACAREVLVYQPLDVLQGGKEMSIGEYLKRERYSDEFTDNYLIVSYHLRGSKPPAHAASAHDRRDMEYTAG